MGNKMQYSPYVVSPNPSVKPMRIQKEKDKKDPKRYPLGKFPFHAVVNFGSRTPNCYEKVAIVNDTNGIILNHPDTIKNASDKVRCKQLLVAKGLPTPKWQEISELTVSPVKYKTHNKAIASDISGLNLKFPIVAKLRVGSGGEGMTYIENILQLTEWFVETQDIEKYFVEEVFQANLKKNYEYRVSVSPLLEAMRIQYADGFPTVLGEIITLRKFLKKEGLEDGSFGRNLRQGKSYFSRDVPREFQRNKQRVSMNAAVSMANEACRACGLDFGAVDVIYDSEVGQWTILEINTAPSMGGDDHTFTLERWKQAIRAMLKEKKEINLK